MDSQQDLQRIAFLDTNILHYIGIYLEYAKGNALFPWSPEKSTAEKERAVARVDNLEDASLKKSLKRGLETIAFLSAQEVQVQYAPVSELELLTGRARGRAILSAAKEGIPDRMWSRLREEEIRERVDTSELTTVKDGVNGLTSLLGESDIAVRTNDRDRTRDVLELAKGINGLIYIEAMDSIIYASALVAKADYLFTADKYLRDTVNYICGPNDSAPYEEIREKLRQLIGDITLGTANGVELPSAHMVTADGTVQPEIPTLEHHNSS